MPKLLQVVLLLATTFALAQAPPTPAPDVAKPGGIEGLTADSELRGKTSLIRGVLKRFDPIHDVLLVHAFGGSDVRIAFDPRTEMLHGSTQTQVTGIPAGSIVSVDTVIEGGKLFARSVRVSTSMAGEVSGQVVRYDAAKSRLILRDPGNPENIALGVTPSTTVVNRDQRVSAASLAPGMLVHVKFVPAQSAATDIQILAERGNTFSFAGRVVGVDLRSRTVALSNTSDGTVRELATNSLDPTSLRLLREGADVSIQAEFDGDRYNARAVTVVPQQ